MKFCKLLALQLLTSSFTSTSGKVFVDNDNHIQGGIFNKRTSSFIHSDVKSMMPSHQKSAMMNSIKTILSEDLERNQQLQNRFLAEGDWFFLNDFLQTFNITIPIDQTFELINIDFDMKTVYCDNFRIKDIATEGTGRNTQYDLTFSIIDITMTCTFDYSYKGGFFIGEGDGTGSIEPRISLDTITTFSSTDFESTGPSGASIQCNSKVDLKDIFVGISFLDVLIGPFLPGILEPNIGSALCDAVEIMESSLSDFILGINDVLVEFTDPLPPEVTDNLYPEQKFINVTSTSFLAFKPLMSLFELGTRPIEMLVEWLNTQIFGDDGILQISLLLPLTERVDLVAVRFVGFNNYTYDSLSVIGQYTFETKFEQDYVGVELELAVQDENNRTDIVIVETGINDLVIDFAMLVVIEDLLTWDVIFSGLNKIIDCISKSLYALEVASFSVNAGSFGAMQISGLSNYAGPQKMLNEISGAIFYMYDNLLINVVNSLFEETARGAINHAIAALLPTCVEEFVGRTIFIPVDSACLKIELFHNGTLSQDMSNPNCDNDEHVSEMSMSMYQYSDVNYAYFSGDWSGKVELKEDPRLSSPDVVTMFDNTSKTFEVYITFSTCTEPCSS